MYNYQAVAVFLLKNAICFQIHHTLFGKRVPLEPKQATSGVSVYINSLCVARDILVF